MWLTAGTALSVLGDQAGWMALLWWVMSRHLATVWMGALSLSYGVAGAIGGVVAGWLMDRYAPRALMLVDATVQGLIFLVMTLAAWAWPAPPWLLCMLLFVAGLLSPVTPVGAMTVLPDIVPAHALVQANAWDETLWQGAQLAGPLLGGLLISTVGVPGALLWDVCTFALCAFCLTHLPRVKPRCDVAESAGRAAGVAPGSWGWRAARTVAVQLADGLRALLSVRIIVVITLAAFVLNLAYGGLEVALPLFVHHRLGQSAAVLGMLWSANAAGLLASTTVMVFGRIGNGLVGERWLALMVAGMGAALVPLAWVSTPWQVAVCLGLAGLCFGPYAPLCRSVIQRALAADLRGRVLGLRATVLSLAGPMGGFIAGEGLRWITSPVWLSCTGSLLVCLGVGMRWLCRVTWVG